MHVRVGGVAWKDLERPPDGQTSAELRERIVAARELQRQRGTPCNARIPDQELDEQVRATAEARALLGMAVDRLPLSARGARRVLRVARTIADLGGDTQVGSPAVAEALSHRALGEA
jgi:magnesium chelatase family protein